MPPSSESRHVRNAALDRRAPTFATSTLIVCRRLLTDELLADEDDLEEMIADTLSVEPDKIDDIPERRQRLVRVRPGANRTRLDAAGEIGRDNCLVGVVIDAGVVDEHIDGRQADRRGRGCSRRPSRPERRPQRQSPRAPFPAPPFRPSPDRARPIGRAFDFARAGDRPRDQCRGSRPSRARSGKPA